jgi:hypothetical protein
MTHLCTFVTYFAIIARQNGCFPAGIDNLLPRCIPLVVRDNRKRGTMGFFSFFKKLFVGEDTDEMELNAARRRHGVISKDEEVAALKENQEMRRFAKEYDAWEEIDQFRWTFFLGGWVAKKIHPIGEDKLKRDLEKLEKRRLQEEEKKKREG